MFHTMVLQVELVETMGDTCMALTEPPKSTFKASERDHELDGSTCIVANSNTAFSESVRIRCIVLSAM